MSNFSLSRISGMNIHYCRFPFEYFLDSMVRLGIENIEIWAASPHIYFEDLKITSSINRIKKKIKERNLNVVCLTPEQCVYPINIAAQETEIRNRSLKYFYSNIEIASELDIPIMLVTPGWGYFSKPNNEAWRRSMESLEQISIRAEKLGIFLALEPISPYNSNIINGLSSLNKMLSKINSSNLKGMLDIGQMTILHEKIKDYFNVLKENLIHIHFIDSNEQGAHLALGDGNLPLKDYIDIISENKYKGYLSLEITDKSYFLDPERAVKKSLKKIEQML